MDQPARRPWGSGSVFLHKGRWTASVAIPSTDGKRRRRWIRCATQAVAEALVAQLVDGGGPPRAPGHKWTHRLTPLDAILHVLERGRLLGWDDQMVARVIVASTPRRRLMLGVLGPCVYCGDELANTVDHVDPDGGDGLDNVVSACRKCNTAKGKRTPEKWRAA